MRKARFLPCEKPATIGRWTLHGTCETFTVSPVWNPQPQCAAIPERPTPSLSLCAVAEKNNLRPVWARAFGVLRSAAAPNSRSLVRRQACLSLVECSSGEVLALRRREDRASRLVVRTAELHSAVCLLRWATLPRKGVTGSARLEIASKQSIRPSRRI